MIRRAFTLIELLVVIAIIAILAAILFPVFAQAKESAKQSQVIQQARQIGTASLLYSSDYDDMIVPWITWALPASVPGDFWRTDLTSWVQNLAVYTKNGKPTFEPTNTNPVGVKPNGIFSNPFWTEQKWRAGSDRPDCNGPGALDSWVPVRVIHAHYGISFGIENTDADRCTNQNPYYYFPGSRPISRAANTWSIMSYGQVERPSGVTLIGEGFTGVINTRGFGTTMGCESSDMTRGGGSFIFVDGHAKFIKGNSQRYLDTDSSGCVYMRYHTASR